MLSNSRKVTKSALLICSLLLAGRDVPAAEIILKGGEAVLRAGGLERVIHLGDGNLRTVSFSIDGHQVLASAGTEFSVRIEREESGQGPRPFAPAEAGARYFFSDVYLGRWRAEVLDPSLYDDPRPDAPKWVDRRMLQSASWRQYGPDIQVESSEPSPGNRRLSLKTTMQRDPVLAGVQIEMRYELYGDHPVVRKSVVIRNGTSHWLRLRDLVIEDLQLSTLVRRPLAAAMFGVQPSVVGFEAPGSDHGVIAVSEIPSALRSISDRGAMGYSPELFEWVLAPGEEFDSEPVFYYGFSGPVSPTLSARSTPLDRAVEGPYMEFLGSQIGIAANTAPIHGPQWMTWAYFYDRIDHQLVHRLADITARAGFTELLLDDGWQKGRLGTDVDRMKFPDFAATSAHIREKGMHLGLWVSCYRDADSRDRVAFPDAPILPELARSHGLPGLAMSFASPWREFYVQDLVGLARRYGVTYFKQDFSNVMYGDVAAGHGSRTRRESLLRGLRALLATQAMLRKAAPEVVNEITHEIYWGTPGVPADLAALKCTARFHIPPNEAFGTDLRRELGVRTISAGEHAEVLRRGCWLARQRFYSHRGLPLHALEFYAAATTNHEGSLDAAMQDRQVASWLMGAPVCFSGDARTLSEDNITHYHKRFAALARLEAQYGIYKHFQFSGVPEPTDVDWHWWGKLNERRQGAVVVIRGSGGADRRAVNIPWVDAERSYRVSGILSGRSYGLYKGSVLQHEGILVALPVNGQEILELQ